MRARIAAEYALLREGYGAVEHAEAEGWDWFRLPPYPLPEGWLAGGAPCAAAPVVFPVKPEYPGATPYGFLMPAGMTFRGAAPNNTGAPPKTVPFPGDWMHFSWQCEEWQACNDPKMGANLLTWVRSFAERLSQGA